jgi:ribosomal protein S18 acetylase RimI-like enzyme
MKKDSEPKIQNKDGGRPQAFKIREMDIDDVAQVFHLGERLFEAERLPNLYRTWDEFEVIELFNGDTENCLVAEAGDEIVGFALGTTVTKSRSAWKYGHLIWLGVDEEFQRFGVAERLFQRFRSVMLAQGVRMLIVDTEAENLSALRFFRKMGFGNPQQHIYLSLNLAAEQQQARKKAAERRNGTVRDDD